jgi:hypothetical protein
MAQDMLGMNVLAISPLNRLRKLVGTYGVTATSGERIKGINIRELKEKVKTSQVFTEEERAVLLYAIWCVVGKEPPPQPKESS